MIASKGIDTKNNKFAYEIIEDILNIKNIGVISGGSFAVDMKNKKVLGLTLGTKKESISTKVKKCLENDYIKMMLILFPEICVIKISLFPQHV